MSLQSSIEVIPWDPKSELHVERLRQQRVACGWGVENVDDWRTQQLAKQKLLLWLVLKPNNAPLQALINSHVRQFPQEAEPLQNTFSSSPSPSSSTTLTSALENRNLDVFIPIGHLALDFDFTPTATAKIDPSQRRIGATSLFISPVMRGLDVARQAIEKIRAVARPYARFVEAEAPVRESREAVERFERFGDGRPRYSVVDWYVSMGWKRLERDKRVVYETDEEGRVWEVELVSMEWDIWGKDEVLGKSRLSRL